MKPVMKILDNREKRIVASPLWRKIAGQFDILNYESHKALTEFYIKTE
ncbi:MAG TPA: hypothetical protein VGI38_12490 [Puia sp.]